MSNFIALDSLKGRIFPNLKRPPSFLSYFSYEVQKKTIQLSSEVICQGWKGRFMCLKLFLGTRGAFPVFAVQSYGLTAGIAGNTSHVKKSER